MVRSLVKLTFFGMVLVCHGFLIVLIIVVETVVVPAVIRTSFYRFQIVPTLKLTNSLWCVHLLKTLEDIIVD